MKKSEETMAVYQKYGVSPTGSCSTLLVQMPILLALYQVIYHIPGYIGSVRNVFQGLTTQMMGVSGYSDILTQFITDNRVTMYSKVSETLTENNLLDMLICLDSAAVFVMVSAIPENSLISASFVHWDGFST